MPTRPYFEYDLDGERHTIEADTWILEEGMLTFYRYVIRDGGAREQEPVDSFVGVDPRSINKIIP